MKTISIAGKSFRLELLQQLIIVLAVVALYGYSLSFGYVLDDKIVITDNQFVKKGFSGIGDILTTEGFEGYFGEQRDLVIGSRYRPLSLVMFAIEYAIVGGQPWLGHLMNILLYALLGLIIFHWSRLTFPKKKKALWWSLPFLIALLYVLHPIHSEAVANIKGRDEILAMLFSILTLWRSQAFVQSGRLKELIWIALSFFLALLSKENSLTFLAVIPLTLLLLSKFSMKRLLPVAGVLALATTGYLAMRFQAVGYLLPQATTVTGDLMNNPFLEMEGGEKWSTIMYTLGKYVQLLLFPHPLTHDYYPYHVPKVGWDNAYVLMSVVTYVVLALWAVLSMRKKPVVTWSIAFFLLTLSIVSNIPFTVGTFMNERFLFMPSLAFSVLSAVGIRALLSMKGIKVFGKVLLIVLIAGYGLKTISRVPAWENGYTLNQAAIKVSRNSARINMFVGTDYYNQAVAATDPGQKRRLLQESKKHLVKAKSIYRLYGSANNMLTGVCAEMFKTDRNIDDLLECFSDVAKDRPNTPYLNQFLDYLRQNGNYTPELISFYENTGYEKLYLERNNYPHAIRYLKVAESLNPGSRTIYEKLSATYFAFGYHLQDYPDPNYKVNEIIESGRYYAKKSEQ